MNITPQDENFLSHALHLASEAAAFASPNPTVGCVLVRDGAAIGEGAHFYDALDHAEIVALKDSAARGHSVAGATAYVTLEPCSHQGRTGPCADALITAGIGRCVVATLDPNPQVQGTGVERMRNAGIIVDILAVTHALALRARQLNDAFAFSIVHGRPFVTLKAAVSVDGMLAPSALERRAAGPHWITGPAAREDVQMLRHHSDAVITGIGTVLADDPTLSDRSGEARRRPLLRVVMDTNLRTPAESKLVRSAAGDLLIFHGSSASAERRKRLQLRGAQTAAAPEEVISPAVVLDELHRLAIRSVLLEAGSALNAAFLRAGFVDRVVLYFGEVEFGRSATPFAAGGPSAYVLAESLIDCTRATFANGSGEDVRIAGYLHRPWQG